MQKSETNKGVAHAEKTASLVTDKEQGRQSHDHETMGRAVSLRLLISSRFDSSATHTDEGTGFLLQIINYFR